MKKTLLSISLLSSMMALSQEKTGINTTTPKATLEIAKTTTNKTADVEGILIPRVSKEKAYLMANATTTPEESTMVYVNDSAYTFPTAATDVQKAKVGDITENGYYFWNTTKWVKVSGQSGNEDIWQKNNSTNDIELIDSDVKNTIKYTVDGYERNYPKGMTNFTIGYDYTTNSLLSKPLNGINTNDLFYRLSNNVKGLINQFNQKVYRNSRRFFHIDALKDPSTSNVIVDQSNHVMLLPSLTQKLNLVRANVSTFSNSSSSDLSQGVSLTARNVDMGSKNSGILKALEAHSLIQKPSGIVNNSSGVFTRSKIFEGNMALIDNMSMFEGITSIDGKADINNLFGLKLASVVNPNFTGNIGKTYGIYLAQSKMLSNSNYGLYVEDVMNATDNNYSIYTNEGKVRFGDLPASTVATDKVVVADASGVLKTKDASSLVSANAEWKDGTNASGVNLIYANQAKTAGNDVVITDAGNIGIGTTEIDANHRLTLAQTSAVGKRALIVKSTDYAHTDNALKSAISFVDKNGEGYASLGESSIVGKRFGVSTLNDYDLYLISGKKSLINSSGYSKSASFWASTSLEGDTRFLLRVNGYTDASETTPVEHSIKIDGDGRMGIGYDKGQVLSEKLQVAGGVKIESLPTSTVATDKVVVADASGVLKTKDASSLVAANAEWKDGTNAAGDNLIYANQAKTAGNDVVITDAGNVGIGTTEIDANHRLTLAQTSAVGKRALIVKSTDYAHTDNALKSAISFVDKNGEGYASLGESSIVGKRFGVSTLNDYDLYLISGKKSLINSSGYSKSASFWASTSLQGDTRFLLRVNGYTDASETTPVEHSIKIDGDGRMGIGYDKSQVLSEKLQVAGGVKIESLPTSTVATDKVVVADANGILKTKDASSLVSANAEWKDGTNASGANLIYANQAKTAGSEVVITDDGRVGIGTDVPKAVFHVISDGYNGGYTNDMLFDIYKNTNDYAPFVARVARGTADNPQPTQNGDWLSGYSNMVYLGGSYNGQQIVTQIKNRYTGDGTTRKGEMIFSTSAVNRMAIKDDGNVGIGTVTPTEKLEVAGNVKATTFIATATGSVFPDYVFEKYYNGNSTLNANYDFKSLNEVETFVKAKGHLPGYTSAKEISKKGEFNMTKVQLTNVEKIEELYLHTIEQEKKIETQNSMIESQQKEINELKSMLKQLLEK